MLSGPPGSVSAVQVVPPFVVRATNPLVGPPETQAVPGATTLTPRKFTPVEPGTLTLVHVRPPFVEWTTVWSNPTDQTSWPENETFIIDSLPTIEVGLTSCQVAPPFALR